MILRRLRVADHPLLETVVGVLQDVTVPGHFETRGDLYGDIASAPPLEDRPRPIAWRRELLKPRAVALPDGVRLSSLKFYPADGGVGWHTDSHNPGWCVYVAENLSAKRGLFLHDGGLVVDEPGYALAFTVGPDSWHAVDAPGPRLSIGLYFQGRASHILNLRVAP